MLLDSIKITLWNNSLKFGPLYNMKAKSKNIFDYLACFLQKQVYIRMNFSFKKPQQCLYIRVD